ncbi:Uncharacterised protein [Mycobacteroides abscessus]|nr:Uncharacterised protein [Mycobacteroides abscessus]
MILCLCPKPSAEATTEPALQHGDHAEGLRELDGDHEGEGDREHDDAQDGQPQNRAKAAASLGEQVEAEAAIDTQTDCGGGHRRGEGNQCRAGHIRTDERARRAPQAAAQQQIPA